jgi:hypothetical protein
VRPCTSATPPHPRRPPLSNYPPPRVCCRSVVLIQAP